MVEVDDGGLMGAAADEVMIDGVEGGGRGDEGDEE